MSGAKTGGCLAKVGLLFLRDCGEPVHKHCKACGRPVCKKHAEVGDDGKLLCAECNGAAGGMGNESSFARERNGYYDRFGYVPYYYGRSRYYSDRDYRSFDDMDNGLEMDTDDIHEVDNDDESVFGVFGKKFLDS